MSLMLSSTTFASSLPLLAPSALKGYWQLNDAEGKAPACNVELSDELIEGTNAYRFTASEQCLQPLSLTELPVAWRPTPDGMTLTNADGSMVAFLALTAPKRYEVMNQLTLAAAAPAANIDYATNSPSIAPPANTHNG